MTYTWSFNSQGRRAWIPVIQKETALPDRIIVPFDVELPDDSKRNAFEVWEVKEGMHPSREDYATKI